MTEQKLNELHKFNPEVVLYTDEHKQIVTRFKSGESIFDEYVNKEALNRKNSGDGVTLM